MDRKSSLAVNARAPQHMRRWTLALMAIVALGACSDVRTPSKANFQRAIQAFWDTRPAICVTPPASTIPFEISGASFFPILRQRADALVAAGLLTRAVVPPPRAAAPERYQYAMTAAGEKALVKGAGTNREAGDAFCGGKVQVKEVRNFTEPSDVLGARASNATYAISIDGLPEWTRNASVLAVYPQLQAELNADKPRDTLLVLRNDGWVDERLMRAQRAGTR